MNPTIASLVCACGIAGLLYLDRDKSARVSWALWIPGVWIATVLSRPLTFWLGIEEAAGNAQGLEGSPMDAALYAALLALALIVLARRFDQTRNLLLSNPLILAYFLYCLISIAWAYYPEVSLKRWIKAIGDLAMVLVIVTDEQPAEAIRRLVTRLAFLALPISVLYIKYFPEYGRQYSVDGLLTNTGVAANKNLLGLTTLVLSLVIVWNIRSLLPNKNAPNRGRRLFAQGTLLAFALVLFSWAGSSTCQAAFILGCVLMFASGRPAIRLRPGRIHVFCAAIILAASGTVLLGGQSLVVESLGRDASMSGRTDIWPAVISAVPNPVFGAGFEGFWLSPNIRIAQEQLLAKGFFPPLVETLSEAHNGYIETYLNLGWVGVCLIVAILYVGYRKCIKVYLQDPALGSLMLAYIAVGAVYSITEAGFRILNPMWIFLLVAIVTASGVTAGHIKIAATGDSRPDGNEPSRSNRSRLASRLMIRERVEGSGSNGLGRPRTPGVRSRR